MIQLIEIIMYAVILLVFTLISVILLIDNIKLRMEFKWKMQEMNELEKEMRFKFNLRR